MGDLARILALLTANFQQNGRFAFLARGKATIALGLVRIFSLDTFAEPFERL